MPTAPARSAHRRPALALATAAALALPAAVAGAQEPTPPPAPPVPRPAPASVPASDPAADSAAASVPFACEPGGLTEGVEYGCRLLARPTVERFSKGPVHWHLARYATREQAQVAGRFTDIVTEVDGVVWLHRFGPEADVPRAGTHTATVGPLPLPRASSYQIEIFHAVMPAGARTPVQTHPGPAAWYVLDGGQCVASSQGVVEATAGEGAVAPPAGTPLQWVNTGTRAERALFVLVRDPGRHRAAPSRARLPDGCDAPAGG